MIINKISINNFKSIKNLTLDLSEMKGLYGVFGLVGSGKTTLSEAILFGLFGSIRNKNNRDLIRWGETVCKIDIDIYSRDKHIELSRTIRGGTSTLDVKVDGEHIMFTNKKDAQKQLENEYYDTNRLIIETLFIISFNNFKSISSMSSQDLKVFLDRILNLNIVTEYSDRCKVVVKELQIDQRVEEANIKSLTAQIERFNQLKDEIIVSDNDYINLCNNLDELNKKKASYDEGRSKKLSKIQEDINDKMSQIRYQDKCMQDIKKNIDFINKKICPTCGAPIDNSKLDDFNTEYKKIVDSINVLKESLQSLQVNYKTTKDKADSAIKNLDDRIKKVVEDITKYKQHKKQIEKYNDTIKQIDDSLHTATKTYKEIESNIIQYSELSDVLNIKVRTGIINNAVPLINKNIDYYVCKLGLPYSISFDDTFHCIINTPTCNGIPITSLSTGQMKTVDMIIILAILKVLLGAFNMNIIFLDELFSNLDSELRDIMCEVLKSELEESYSNGCPMTTFLISHSPINENMLSGKVVVDRNVKNNESIYSITKY